MSRLLKITLAVILYVLQRKAIYLFTMRLTVVKRAVAATLLPVMVATLLMSFLPRQALSLYLRRTTFPISSILVCVCCL